MILGRQNAPRHPVMIAGSSSSAREALVDALVPAYTSRPRETSSRAQADGLHQPATRRRWQGNKGALRQPSRRRRGGPGCSAASVGPSRRRALYPNSRAHHGVLGRAEAGGQVSAGTRQRGLTAGGIAGAAQSPTTGGTGKPHRPASAALASPTPSWPTMHRTANHDEHHPVAPTRPGATAGCERTSTAAAMAAAARQPLRAAG
jgi:hypothetical protein